MVRPPNVVVLEVNDRIVSIGGYQVGYVNGTLYDVGTEFERHADRNGWVRILVQNNRDGNLITMPLQLDPRNESITGTIAYRDRSALPRDAVATVELREVLRSDLQPVTIARQTISPATRVPITFSMEYDPAEIDSRRSYVIDANITAGGQTDLRHAAVRPHLQRPSPQRYSTIGRVDLSLQHSPGLGPQQPARPD